MIIIEDLNVRLGRTDVIASLNLTFGAGVHGLLGPNGAGKSTLIRVLATVLRHNSGRVELLGHPLDRSKEVRAVRQQLGYLPQAFGFYRSFTVREYVEYLAWLKKMPTAQIALAADRAIERVDLGAQADTKLSKLSGGMLRRAGLATRAPR